MCLVSLKYLVMIVPLSGHARSFKLVDGSNIITGAVVPVEPNQTTLLVRDIPYQSNDSALVSVLML